MYNTNYPKILKDMPSILNDVNIKIEEHVESFNIKCDKNKAINEGWISKNDQKKIDLSNSCIILISKNRNKKEICDEFRNQILDILEKSF